MKILALGIANFKQFIEAEFDFEEQGDSSPFALVVGSNGAGKTTLLSALFFAFHGNVLPSLDDPKHLCNSGVFEALEEGEETSIIVWVRFSTGGSRYTVQRKLLVRKTGLSEARLEEDLVVFNHTDNATETPPQMWLNRVFPANLAKFLFFPGEQLEDFFNPDKFAAFVDDIKTLSGLDRLDMLQSAIQSTIQKLDKRIKSIPGDDQNKPLMEALAACESELSETSALLAETQQDLQLKTSRHADLGRLLKSSEAEFEILREAETIRARIPGLESQVKNASADLTRLYSSFGWVTLTADIANEARNRAGASEQIARRHRGLPASLVGSLLTSDRCICGRTIGTHTEPERVLRELLEAPANSFNASAYLDLLDATSPGGSLDASAVSEAVEQTWDAISRAEEQLSAANQSLSNLSHSRDLGSHSEVLALALQEVVELDQRIPELSKKVVELRVRMNALEARQQTLLGTVNQNLAESKTFGALAKRRQSLTRISKSFEADATQMRGHIQETLRQMLKEALPPIFNFEDFEVQVADDFQVAILQNGRIAATSEGQRKSIAFAIIASLTKLASELVWTDSDSNNALDNAYPLVIDAGFAELSDYFSKFTLSWLKDATSQVILISLPEISYRLIDLIPASEVSEVYLLRLQFESRQGEDETWASQFGEVKLRVFGANKTRTSVERLKSHGVN